MLTQDDLKEIKNLLNPLEKDMVGVKKDLKEVKKRIVKIEKTTDTMVDLLDVADVKLHTWISHRISYLIT